jgi:glycosyltransferase involved in cell wall biosynthesis
MRILIIVDKFNWAYHAIAKNLVKYNPKPEWRLDIEKAKKNKKRIKKISHKYDYFFVMGWQNFPIVSFLPKDKTLVGIHSFHSWDERKTTPELSAIPPVELIGNLNEFLGVNAVSQRLTDLFRGLGVSKIHYTPNGSDIELFKPPEKRPDTFYAGYSGTKKHDWRKGITEFILPATKKAGVPCKLAMHHDKTEIPSEKMPQFYQQLGCYVCASSSEGFSLSVLEAAACGVPVISTRVGGCTELIADGVNGYLVDRDVDAIADRLNILKNDKKLQKSMSDNMRSIMVREYSWKDRVVDWFDFMEKIL